jgi:hypothetical protein
MESSSSIYYEALWVLSLFAATAILREAFGELCVHKISKSILSCSHISGDTLDVFLSCSNSGRSLGFGAAWRMWNIDKTRIVIPRNIIVLPFSCWLVGMPIKLVAVQAVRGGNPYLGSNGTWALGILWIVICIACKVVAIWVDRYHGLRDNNGKIVSYRRIFQARFCSLESYGMMLNPLEYDETVSYINPKRIGPALGIDCSWTCTPLKKDVKMTLVRRNGVNDPTKNGLEEVQLDFDVYEDSTL